MKRDVVPPIFVQASDGVDAFASVREAEACVESPDIDAGEYRALYDATGRQLRFELLRPTQYRRWWIFTSIGLAPVRIVAAEANPSHQLELQSMLADALQQPMETPLEQLVSAAAVALRRR